MKLQQLIDALEEFAPLNLQESYDNSGLLVGNPDETVNAALFTLDTTEAVIDEAIQKGCNVVIAHHPIIFSGLKKLNGKTYIERTVIKAIKNDISIYAAHTNLDNSWGGVNFKIAEKLALKNLAILSPKEELKVGSGVIGELAASLDVETFLAYLKIKMDLKVIRHTELVKSSISKVAVCGGSGSFLLQNAIKAQADVFITADFKYHEFFDAENHLFIADIGHFESEQYTKELFRDIISKKFPNFATYLSEVTTNPINYYF